LSVPASSLPQTFNAAAYFVDRHVSEGRGQHVAIECGDQTVTYAQVLARVNRVGSALRSQLGVRAEERIVLLLPDGPEWIYSFFGAIKIGAVPVPISTLWKPADYEYVLNDSRAGVVIVDEALLPHVVALPRQSLGHLREVVVVGDGTPPAGARRFSDLLSHGSEALEPDPTSKDAPAFWLYSSGSTGVPKGCVHLQHDMVVCADAYARGVLGISAADRCFSVAKLFFAYGLGNALYFPFAVGATTILWPGPPTAANVYAVVEKHRPTLLFSVPTNYAMLLACTRQNHEFDLSSIRCAVSAGEPLPPALFERFRARFGIDILDGIGSTEVLHIFISNRPGEVRPGSCGRVVDGYEAKIVDDEGRPVAAGELGSLLVKGDSTCAFFWNQHEKTKATIEGQWIRTGDQFSQDAEGYYWYAGRSDDMLKVGGIWVSPVEVENMLLEHPAVLECAVAGRLDADGLVKPAAFVVLRPTAERTQDLAIELQQFVRARAAEYKRPRWICFVAELPKTGTGKVQRFKLRQSPPGELAFIELR
jgi:benzoate-CoA ligase family protein